MGGGSSGKGGVADATLNVVPFIDLLACLICFLLLSAVWNQMSRIDVDQALPKATKTPPKEPPKPEAKINVVITPTGYLVNLWNADKLPTPKPDLVTPKKIPTIGTIKIERTSGAGAGRSDEFKKYDKAKLREQLQSYMKDANLDDKTKIMVAADDKVPYMQLILTLDTILATCKNGDLKSGKDTCLKNPSIGDVNLLRSEDFSTFE